MYSFLMDNNEFGKLPDNNTSSKADIQRMHCTKLRNFQSAITHIYDVLLYAYYLITKNNRQLSKIKQIRINA